MLLGDLLAQFEDEVIAAQVLTAMDDLPLMSKVADAAADREITVGEFAVEAVQRFASQAGDEAWMSMMAAMGRTDDPGRVLLQRALAAAIASPKPPQRISSHLNTVVTLNGR